MENVEKAKSSQTISLEDRKRLVITGVEKMLSVRPDLVQMSTSQGALQVVGTNMEMSRLDLEQQVVEVVGTINQIKFVDGKKQPIFKRIFK